jgi:hypothetical protein
VLDVPSDSDRSDIARAPFLTLPLGRHIQGNASFPVHHIFTDHRVIVLLASVVYICSSLGLPTSFAVRRFQLLWENPASVGSPGSRD